MEDELALLLMAAFFRWVAVADREGSDEYRERGSGYNEKESLFRVYTGLEPSGVGRT